MSCCINKDWCGGKDNGGTSPCLQCKGKKDLELPTCGCFDDEALRKEVAWCKYQQVVETSRGGGAATLKTRLKRTFGEAGVLVGEIKDALFSTLQHRFKVKFLNQQYHIDMNTHGDNEAVMLVDFASAMELGAGSKGTCETTATCNLYVMLVLFKAPVYVNGACQCSPPAKLMK